MINRDRTLTSLSKPKVKMNEEKSIHDVMRITMYQYLIKVVVRSVHQNSCHFSS